MWTAPPRPAADPPVGGVDSAGYVRTPYAPHPLFSNLISKRALIATLVEYAACDLNAKVAARRLHLHVNTAYYRLERIAERTGCDLRRLADVVELLIAVRMLRTETS